MSTQTSSQGTVPQRLARTRELMKRSGCRAFMVRSVP